MSTEVVWRLVEQARAEISPAADETDLDRVAARVTELLIASEPEQVVAFDRGLWELLARSYREDLWGAAYLIRGGCSDDGFDYFRGWLIVAGEAVYEQALSDPDSLAGLPSIQLAASEGNDCVECEDVLAAAWSAHRELTGHDLPPDDHWSRLPELSDGWDFDDADEMRAHLPRLAGLYYSAS